jgi:hypothetical protein
MTTRAFLLRVLFPLGVLSVVLGTLDPIEGSVLIVAGFAMLVADAFVTGSRNRTLLTWALALSAVGVAAMFILSAFGGVRMRADGPGHSPWWALVMLPYPVGWLLGVVGAARSIAAHRQRPATTG